MDSSSSAIKIENVWKVFGNTSPEALDAIQNKGISKTEALEEVLPNTFQTFSIFIAELDESILSFITGKYTRQSYIAEYKI